MSNKYIQITFTKTFMPDYSELDYRESGITTIEQAAAYEKYQHDEGFVTPAEFLQYEDNDYDNAFQVVEIGELLPDGSVEVIQPEVGSIVVIATTYTSTWDNGKQSKTETHTSIYRRTINGNKDELSPWRDYYQDVSESYVGGVTWQNILEMIANKTPNRDYKVEIMEPRPHYARVVYTAPDRTVDLFEEAQDAQHESA